MDLNAPGTMVPMGTICAAPVMGRTLVFRDRRA